MLKLPLFRRWTGQEKQVVEEKGEGRGLKKWEEEDSPVKAGSGTPKIEAGLIQVAGKEVLHLQGGGMTSGAETLVGAERLKG